MADRFFIGRRYVNPVVEARRPRPREVARLPEHLRRDLHHEEVREEYILIDRTSIEDFFGWTEPLTMPQVEHLVQREAGWPTAFLQRSISSNGGLRLHVWAGNLPSPAEHFQQCCIRLPILAHAPRAENYFLAHACAQPEMREGVATNRCPMCASHLFGYPMRDHTLQDCPFADFNTYERLEFMATNHFAWCPRCGSRSPNHVAEACYDWPFCTGCHEYGHNHVQDMCDGHPLGLPTLEAREAVENLVTRFRTEFYIRIQNNLRYAPVQRKLKYRLHLDHTFTQLFRERARFADVQGWGPYMDHERRFAHAPLSLYANYRRRGLKDQYDTLVVPEFTTRKLAKIPEFAEDEHNYLEQIATLVSAIKDRAPRNTLTLPNNPPQTLRPAMPEPRVPPQQPLRRPRGPEGRPPTPERQQDAPVQRRLEHPRPAHASQSLMQPQRTPAPAETSYLDVSALQDRSWVDIQNEEDQPRLDTTRSSRPSQSLPTNSVQRAEAQQQLRYVSAQNPHNVQSTSSTVVHAASNAPNEGEEEYATSDGSCQSGYAVNSNSSGREVRARSPKQLPKLSVQAHVEQLLDEEALSLCQAPMPVEYAPARTYFQHEAFALVNGDLPYDKIALIGRVRTLQLVLTGQADLLPGELEDATTEDLLEYAHFLQCIGQALKKELVMIVQLENDNPERILEKATGSDVTRIPSFGLRGNEAARQYLRGLMLIRLPDEPSFLNKFGSTRKWVTKSLPKRNQPDLELSDELLRLSELSGLAHPTPGYAFVTPEDVLEEALKLARPITNRMILEPRVRWMQWMLTGEEPIAISKEKKQGRDTLNDYLDILVGVTKVALHGRRHHYGFQVSMHNCMRSMANIANDRHNLVFPTWSLFKQAEPENWFAWMDAVLCAAVQTMIKEGPEETCLCH